MPSSMKIQPIDDGSTPSSDEETPPMMMKPLMMKSRLRRLFRINFPEKPQSDDSAVTQLRKEEGSGEVVMLEPSSVCLDRMVQNFIEEGATTTTATTEKNQVVKCGRSRCNCFNGSDGSDGDGEYSIPASDVSDLIKGLMGCVSGNERSVMAETGRIVDKNKGLCKRKADFGRVVAEGLIAVGFDASVCKSKWEKSPTFPAGEYEYVDVIMEGERLIIDIDFRSEFEIAKATKAYKAILQTLPYIFVGKSDRLSRIITLASEAAKQSLKKKGMHLPPWRRTEYVRAKWLSPHTRLTSNPTITTPITPTPTPVNSLNLNVLGNEVFNPEVVTEQSDGKALSLGSPEFETLFSMSESPDQSAEKVKSPDQAAVKMKSPDEAAKVNVIEIVPSCLGKAGSRVGSKVGGLASLMVEKP